MRPTVRRRVRVHGTEDVVYQETLRSKMRIEEFSLYFPRYLERFLMIADSENKRLVVKVCLL